MNAMYITNPERFGFEEAGWYLVDMQERYYPRRDNADIEVLVLERFVGPFESFEACFPSREQELEEERRRIEEYTKTKAN